MFCPKCGTELNKTATQCFSCNEAVVPSVSTRRIEDDPGMRLLLPVGRSGWAIAAGYAGLFAFAIVPAPIAMILGIIALGDIKKNPTKLGKGRAIFGLVAGILGTFFLFLTIILSKLGGLHVL